MTSTTDRSVYLIVFRSPVFPAHWALWIPCADDSSTGKLINAVGDPATGFSHEFQRNFCPASTAGAILTVLLSDCVGARHIVDGPPALALESTIDADAVDDLERVALTIPPPRKSLNSVSTQEVRVCTGVYLDSVAHVCLGVWVRGICE